MQGVVLGNVDPRTFLINVSKLNEQLARNLYLLCGDPSIELVGRSLEQKRGQNSTLSPFGQYAWKSVTTCIKQFIAKIAERKGIKLMVFIDVNSSFSILTEIALAASDKILIPITEDHLHRNGFEYMFALLFGFSQPSSAYFYYRHLSFYYRANEFDVKLPKIHLILNKVPANPSESPYSKTTQNSDDSNWEFIFDLYKKHPQAFHLKSGKLTQIQNVQEFKNEFVIDIYENYTTTQTMREAVRCHSPLLSVKSSFRSYTKNLNSSINNLSASSMGSVTPKLARSASPQIKSRNFFSKKQVSYENSSHLNGTVTYPFQHQQHINKPVVTKNPKEMKSC